MTQRIRFWQRIQDGLVVALISSGVLLLLALTARVVQIIVREAA